MATRSGDGSAGDADYGVIGGSYTRYRQPDPRIAAQVSQALGPARTVLNVGARAGSYEPAGRTEVTPVPVPLDCTDGFGEAYYGRPEALLDPGARRANSAWSFVGDDVQRRFERDLRRDLGDGT
jgi:hypothetical protein